LVDIIVDLAGVSFRCLWQRNTASSRSQFLSEGWFIPCGFRMDRASNWRAQVGVVGGNTDGILVFGHLFISSGSEEVGPWLSQFSWWRFAPLL
jgi:hypothetical protein